MKRTPLRRKASLRSSSSLPRTGALKPVGKQKPKREARTKALRNSAHTRQWRKDVLARDGHRCTAVMFFYREGHAPSAFVFATGTREAGGSGRRCEATEDLHVHHRRYRNLGAELLDDGVVLCAAHHRHVEQELRWFKAGRFVHLSRQGEP